MTHRQYTTWEAWVEAQWNQPDRSDHYLMLLCTILSKVNSKNPDRVTMSGMKIKFTRPDSSKVQTKEGAAEMSKVGWFGRLGIDPPRKSRDSSGAGPDYPSGGPTYDLAPDDEEPELGAHKGSRTMHDSPSDVS
jgi:hypothetical protein